MAIKKTDIMKLVKLKCSDCCCGDKVEVKECNITRCPLHSIRLGTKGVDAAEPVVKRTRAPMTDEHKEKLRLGRENAKTKG